MKFVKTISRHILMTAVMLGSLASCGLINEDDSDCDPIYKVRFLFEKNMLFTDAFRTQVGEVDLYVFDSSGNLVWKGHEEGDILAQEGYLMDLPVDPGNYELVAWCHKRHENASGFNLAGADNPLSFDDLKMKLEREYDGEQAHSSTDLHALFHGKVAVDLPDEWGLHVINVPLTKDTNCIRIMLVHLSGKEIKEDDFDFKITDSNGYLGHDNRILDDEPVEYRAWFKQEGIASMLVPSESDPGTPGISPLPEQSRAVTPIYSLMAEMTTSRLQTCNNPMLTITRKSDGERVVNNLPLLDYLLMVKGQYNRNMDDDDYLDRQDEYNMTFFMLEDGSWYRQVIDILKWRIVRQSADL